VTTTGSGERVLTARQAQLLDQLEELFLAEGFARFTLEDLAVRLRCSKTTLYALAGSKEQLAVRVVRHFFRRATADVEARTAGEGDPARRVTAYLEAVARALTPASRAFRRDLEAFPPGRAVYEHNTAVAVHPALVADTVTTSMLRIGRGDTARATGLDDAAAYRELAALLLHGISR
jgi:AcrR family transcriptional regulator